MVLKRLLNSLKLFRRLISHAGQTPRTVSSLKIFRYSYGGRSKRGRKLEALFKYEGADELVELLTKLEIETVQHHKKPEKTAPTSAYGPVKPRLPAPIIKNTSWIENPGHTKVFGEPAFVWCDEYSISVSISDKANNTSLALVNRALYLEERMQSLSLRTTDQRTLLAENLKKRREQRLKNGDSEKTPAVTPPVNDHEDSELNDRSITIMGEYWERELPPYRLEYFKFKPASGGGIGYLHPELEGTFVCDDNESFLTLVMEIKAEYPYLGVSVHSGSPAGLRIRIISDFYFDFAFCFAIEVEHEMMALQRMAKLKPISSPDEVKGWGRNLKYGHGERIRNHTVRFPEKGISWVSRDTDKRGLAANRIRIDMHHPEQIDDAQFFKNLCILLDDCNIEFLEYKVLEQNYMLFLGNGRQGVDGAPVTQSKIVKFRKDVLALLECYGFILRHNPKWSGREVGLSNYFRLVKVNSIILKDERRQ